MAATRRQASKLKQLIEERDPDLLPSVVHLARSLDDGEIVDTLLDGATYEKRRLEPGKALAHLPRRSRHHARMATLALIATGIGERARALRERIVRLELTHSYRDHHGNHATYDPATPVSLELLSGLPLRTLRVSGLALEQPELLRTFENLEGLVVDTIKPEHLERLERLKTLVAGIQGDYVPTLAACEELQVNAAGALRIDAQPSLLTFTTWNRTRVQLGAAPLLYRAEMPQSLELVVDEPLPALRHLHIAGTVATPQHLIALEDLRTRSQVGVARLPALRRLDLEGSATSLAELEGTALDVFRGPDRSLTTLVGYPRSSGAPHRRFPSLLSLTGVDAIRGIETLELRAIRSLDGIQALKDTLRGLDLRDCVHLHDDMSALEGLDLRVILVAGTDLRAKSFPPSVRWAVVRKRNASVAALAMREP